MVSSSSGLECKRLPLTVTMHIIFKQLKNFQWTSPHTTPVGPCLLVVNKVSNPSASRGAKRSMRQLQGVSASQTL
jgi:hypothetical protein